jgi:hypothetical protein
MPEIVVKDVSPKLLTNVNVPSPPSDLFITMICPVKGGAMMVLIIVHVVAAPAATMIAAGVPFVQVALIWVQPAGTVSATL